MHWLAQGSPLASLASPAETEPAPSIWQGGPTPGVGETGLPRLAAPLEPQGERKGLLKGSTERRGQ